MCINDPAYLGSELLHAYRFALIAFETCCLYDFTFVGHRRGRHGDDRDLTCSRISLEVLESSDPVHPRQVNVHENESRMLDACDL